MQGYTPVFGSIYTGTLYGKWPTAAVWASLLPLFDKNGVLDLSVEALCGMTGWPRELLLEGIHNLMQPDPNSRTKGEDGRRLVPLDPEREWGWRAVNHGKYREKARKAASDSSRAEDGRNAERMRDRRDPLRPAVTRAHPPSDSNADTDSDSGSFHSSPSTYVSKSSLGLSGEERFLKTGEPEKRPQVETLVRGLAQAKRP